MAKLFALLYAVLANMVFVLVFVYFIGFVGNVAVPKSIDSGVAGEAFSSTLVNLALLTLFALQHTLMARNGFKQRLARILPPAIERASYVLLSSAVLALLCWQWRALPAVVWQVDNRLLDIALTALFALGWGIGLVAAKAMDILELFGLHQVLRHLRGTAAVPARFGKPGLYALVRHPMMTGFLLSFWATPLMTVGHMLFALVMTAYIYIATRFFEERDLQGTFGETYAQYRREVPMLIPRWPRR
ncbi:MAG TPA: isoprenylcysteine carboxylmethyltransferase family protein [Usitatibacteraceae bacterium]